MSDILTAVVIFAGAAISYFLGFLTCGMLASAYRSEVEQENVLLAGRNRELELEIEKLKGGDKILRFDQVVP